MPVANMPLDNLSITCHGSPAEFRTYLKGKTMGNHNGNVPLEHLAAFAIVFVAGFLTCACFGKYIEKVKKDAQLDTRRPIE